jgi:hypothetical protein
MEMVRISISFVNFVRQQARPKHGGVSVIEVIHSHTT